MSFAAFINSCRRVLTSANEPAPYQPNTSKLTTRLLDVFLRTYDLGFIAFGGPPVHFQIFHRRFVDGLGKTPWIDEQTYQELFAVAQAFPGPGSTKMLFSIIQIHAGLIPALLVFIIWSLPGGLSMYGLALGVRHVGEFLPGPVYALLSGLNASTVGIIALAAVQLSRKAITDPLTRLLVTFGACAGLLYSALWYFPVLLVFSGTVTVLWDRWGISKLQRLMGRVRGRTRSSIEELEAATETQNLPMHAIKPDIETQSIAKSGTQRRQAAPTPIPAASTLQESGRNEIGSLINEPSHIDAPTHNIPVKYGISVILFFFGMFTVFMVLRGTLRPAPHLLSLFNNMLLAGTIIFGGGPVVIPLLRDYVVDPGWVSPRDFLLGIAVIQAMPGPNFNIAVYLGALAANGQSPTSSFVGAVLAFLGIFMPGLWLSIGLQSIWRSLRKRREVASLLRGINATAVGFVFTAVYRLWEIGYLTPEATKGSSLGLEPWWLVVAASTFTAVEWFGVPPPLAIVTGGAAGLGWYGAVGRH